LSRDGDRVAYQLVWADAESRSNRSRVVVRRVLDPDPIEATAGPRRDHSPEWSPDGRRLAFVSRKGAADQIFVLDLPGSEPVQASFVPEGAHGPQWSPDGSHLAFLGRVLSDPDDVVDDPRAPESSDAVRRSPVARVARRLGYKHDGEGYVDGRRAHLFVTSLDGASASQVTSGSWDVTDFAWSADGQRLALIGNADENADLTRETHLYRVDLSGSLEKIHTGYDLAAPAWSPTGDNIAFVAVNSDEAGLLERVFVVPATGGQARCLTMNLDLAVGDGIVTDMRAGHGMRICWSREGDRVYFTASGPGMTGIYSVDLQGEVRAEVGGDRRIFDFDVQNGVIAFASSEPSDPGELHVLMQGAEARLTDLNPWLRDRYIAQPEEHSFTAPDDWVLQGWLLKPPGFDPNLAYPLVMMVHGGPHAEYGWAFFHELQILAGMGFLVFFMNPRGSDGYGEVFRRAVVRDWGGKDYIDLMSALDQLIERTGNVDTSRLGIGGGSYGGFMTNWVIGQTDRFAAAVAMRSISNLVSEYAQHDIVLWGELQLGPAPWPDLDELWRRSPIRYVNNVKTPLLLTAGEMDLRCAMSQSEELFGALRLLGKTVELVRFPEETHDLSRIGRPDRRVERLKRIADWYERYLGTHTSEKRLYEPALVEAPAMGPVEEPVVAEAAAPLEGPAPEPVPEPEPEPEITVVPEPAEPVATVPPEPEPVLDELEPPVPAPEPQPEPEVEPEPEPAPVAAEPAAVLETVVLDSGAYADTAPPPAAVTETVQVEYHEPAPPLDEEVTRAMPLPLEPEPVEAAHTAEPEPASEPAAEAAPEPEPEPVPPTVPPAISSTVMAWAQGVPPPSTANGPEPAREAEVATSIMPAWQLPQAAATAETLALSSVTPDQAATEAPAKLTFETGPFAGRVVGVPQASASVGRAPSNDIIIGDPATSGRHARIELRHGEYWISDLGSTNGTLVNGEPIIDKQLGHGDVISIGQNTIRFTLRS
jgi:dipeptidyl aminopeptidase/acylaminoacyl peptidase